jgi:hypothetical protein
MIKSIKFLTTLMTMILLSSFTYENHDEITRTCGVSVSDPSQIKLTINPDHTFYYQDFSISDNRIIIRGQWTLSGNKVRLKDHKSSKKFHKVWVITKNGQVAKSRKGITFYRLCRIKE